jgi:hypothetical protein
MRPKLRSSSAISVAVMTPLLSLSAICIRSCVDILNSCSGSPALLNERAPAAAAWVLAWLAAGAAPVARVWVSCSTCARVQPQGQGV